jgi:hypothetical protein
VRGLGCPRAARLGLRAARRDPPGDGRGRGCRAERRVAKAR